MKIHFALNDINQVADQIIAYAQEQRVWLFKGNMGVGKTTLIKCICKQLNVSDAVSSPTFSIVNEYWMDDENKPLYHFDFYRIKNEEEAMDLGVEEYLFSSHYCFIEWPQRIVKLLPSSFLEVNLLYNSDDQRILELNHYA